MGAEARPGPRECTSQPSRLVPFQIMLMITAAGEAMSAADGEEPAEQRGERPRARRGPRGRPGRRRPATSTAIAPSTSPHHREPRRHQRHLERVADEDRVGEEREPADQRDEQHDADRRDPDRAEVRAAARSGHGGSRAARAARCVGRTVRLASPGRSACPRA